MRKTPLLLAALFAIGALVALSGPALAKGGGGGSASANHATGGQSTASHPSSHANGKASATGGAPASHSTSGPSDQDVPGKAFDPSFKSSTGTETRDNGLGNDCDPGFGGSNPKGTGTDHGNDAGHHGVSNTSETEVSGCRTTGGAPGGGGGGGGVSGSGGGVGGTGTGTTPTGGVLGVTVTKSGFGGGLLGAAGGVGGAAAAAVPALANTGLRSVALGLLALMLLLAGLMLLRRPRRQTIA